MEDWVTYQKRIFRQAIEVIDKCGLDIGRFLKKKKIDFMGHVSRLAIGDRETHIVKHVLLWRPIWWWRLQQIAIRNGHPFVHPRVGKIKRFENQFHRDWVNKFSKTARDELC